jgi:hypothetical protein
MEWVNTLIDPENPARPDARIHPRQPVASNPTVMPVRHYFEELNTVDHRTPIPAMGIYVHRLQLASVARCLWDNVGLIF